MKVKLVSAACWNNSTNVLFIMKPDDSRLEDANYKILADADYSKITGTASATVEGTPKTYQVFSDWSVKELETTGLKIARSKK